MTKDTAQIRAIYCSHYYELDSTGIFIVSICHKCGDINSQGIGDINRQMLKDINSQVEKKVNK